MRRHPVRPGVDGNQDSRGRALAKPRGLLQEGRRLRLGGQGCAQGQRTAHPRIPSTGPPRFTHNHLSCEKWESEWESEDERSLPCGEPIMRTSRHAHSYAQQKN